MPTLVVNGRATEAHLESHHLIIRRRDKDDSVQTRHVPLHDVDRVFLIGMPHVSIPALCEFLNRGISVAFISSSGRWLGSLWPDNNLNGTRRLLQYRRANSPSIVLRIARNLIAAKIMNSRKVLQRLAANRSQTQHPLHLAAVAELEALAAKAASENSLDSLRGYEGLAAAKYFNRLKTFFPQELPFHGRSHYPPPDPVNALLSWTYTIVLSELDCLAKAHGLDTSIGFLHQLGPGRPNLSLDLLEPFRPAICDLLCLNLLCHHQFTNSDFEFSPHTGGWLLKKEAKKKFFFAYETAMTRKFAPQKNAPHTDYRKELENAVLQLISALENENIEPKFFALP